MSRGRADARTGGPSAGGRPRPHVTPRHRVRALGPDTFLVVHAASGDVHVLSRAQLRALEAVRAGRDVGAPLLRELRRLGYVFDRPEDEEAAFEALCQASLAWYMGSARRGYGFVLDLRCNFGCAYCFEARPPPGARARLTRAQIDAGLAVVRDEAETSGPGTPVELFGGEPLLPRALPAVAYLLEQLASLGARVSVTTNGYHLDAFAGALARHEGSVDTVQVTLDGLAPTHDARRALVSGEGTFERIVRNVDVLRAAVPSARVVVRVNVDRHNLGELARLATFFAGRGWTGDPRMSFVASPVENRNGAARGVRPVPPTELFAAVAPLSRERGGGPYELYVFRVLNHVRALFAAHAHRRDPPPFHARVKRCEATTLKQWLFHPDGRVYTCPEVMGRPERSIGEYAPALRIDPARAAAWSRHSILTDARCRRCEVSTLCGGPCPVAAEGGASPGCDDGPAVLDAYLGALAGAAT